MPTSIREFVGQVLDGKQINAIADEIGIPDETVLYPVERTDGRPMLRRPVWREDGLWHDGRDVLAAPQLTDDWRYIVLRAPMVQLGDRVFGEELHALPTGTAILDTRDWVAQSYEDEHDQVRWSITGYDSSCSIHDVQQQMHGPWTVLVLPKDA